MDFAKKIPPKYCICFNNIYFLCLHKYQRSLTTNLSCWWINQIQQLTLSPSFLKRNIYYCNLTVHKLMLNNNAFEPIQLYCKLKKNKTIQSAYNSFYQVRRYQYFVVSLLLFHYLKNILKMSFFKTDKMEQHNCQWIQCQRALCYSSTWLRSES